MIAFGPLAGGRLTGKYQSGIPADSRIMTDGRFLHADVLTDEKLAKIRALADLAASRGQTLAQMALAWDLRDGAVTSVLIGASRSAQILDNLGALANTHFAPEELSAIDLLGE